MTAEEALKQVIYWVEDNRSYIEVEAGIGVYRDHFNSEDLIKFLGELVDSTID